MYRINKFLWILIFNFPLITFATLPNTEEEIGCEEKINQLVREIKIRGEWKRVADPLVGVKAYIAPIGKMGEWAQIKLLKHPELSVFFQDRTQTTQWDSKTCTVQKSFQGPSLQFPFLPLNGFSDLDLQALIEDENKIYFLYIWSPSMVYSVSELNVFKEVVEKMGIEFIPLLGTQEDPHFIRSTLEKEKIDIPVKYQSSRELVFRNGNIHFPTSYIIQKGKISTQIFGVMEGHQLREEIEKRL